MNEILDNADIEYRVCPRCKAALEANVKLRWEVAHDRDETHKPAIKCATCGYNVEWYDEEDIIELLETVGIDPSEETKRSATWGQ
jgi:DNA-directed RNA polymerase subunit RPC12/RpoP